MRQIVSLSYPSLHRQPTFYRRQPILPFPRLCNSRAMLHRTTAFRAYLPRCNRIAPAIIPPQSPRIMGASTG